jgi:membrane-associated phospholipid phosphatase
MTPLHKKQKYLNKKLLLLLFLCSVCFHAQAITFHPDGNINSSSILINQDHSIDDYNTSLSSNQPVIDTTKETRNNQSNPNTLCNDLPEYRSNYSFWPVAIGSVVLSAALIPTDKSTFTFLRDLKEHNSLINTISPVVTQLGNGNFAIALFGGFGIYHFISGNEKSWDVTKVGFESFLLSGATVQILKNIFSRERPSAASENGGKWNGVFARFKMRNKNQSITDFDSFPSGHSATAFAAASTLSYFYPVGAVPYIAYSLATVVAVSRVMEETHWVSDCVLGAGIGYLSTMLITKWNNFTAKTSVGIIPVNNGLALNIGYKF